MTPDKQLRLDIEAQLSENPALNSSAISVAVRNGVVTLAGHVPTFTDRWTAERITKRVAGVRGIANEVEVRPITLRTDEEIATAALTALQATVSIPAAGIKVIVRNGWVSLDGHVSQWHQSKAAEAVVRGLWGVKGIINALEIRPVASENEVSQKIRAAFKRHAVLEASEIRVAVLDGTVTLSGAVHSWREREDAEAAAWSAPGITRVKNDLSLSV